MAKPKVATTSMCGCFGCHMSFLDIDERILQLVELVEFDKSPIDDIKKFTGRCAVGLIEGSCANDENVHTLKDFREHCDVLIALGGCAVGGDIPAMRKRRPAEGVPRRGLLQQPDDRQPREQDPRRPRAAADARQDLPDRPGREGRLLPARLPPQCRHDLGGPDGRS